MTKISIPLPGTCVLPVLPSTDMAHKGRSVKVYTKISNQTSIVRVVSEEEVTWGELCHHLLMDLLKTKELLPLLLCLHGPERRMSHYVIHCGDGYNTIICPMWAKEHFAGTVEEVEDAYVEVNFSRRLRDGRYAGMSPPPTSPVVSMLYEGCTGNDFPPPVWTDIVVEKICGSGNSASLQQALPQQTRVMHVWQSSCSPNFICSYQVVACNGVNSVLPATRIDLSRGDAENAGFSTSDEAKNDSVTAEAEGEAKKDGGDLIKKDRDVSLSKSIKAEIEVGRGKKRRANEVDLDDSKSGNNDNEASKGIKTDKVKTPTLDGIQAEPEQKSTIIVSSKSTTKKITSPKKSKATQKTGTKADTRKKESSAPTATMKGKEAAQKAKKTEAKKQKQKVGNQKKAAAAGDKKKNEIESKKNDTTLDEKNRKRGEAKGSEDGKALKQKHSTEDSNVHIPSQPTAESNGKNKVEAEETENEPTPAKKKMKKEVKGSQEKKTLKKQPPTENNNVHILSHPTAAGEEKKSEVEIGGNESTPSKKKRKREAKGSAEKKSSTEQQPAKDSYAHIPSHPAEGFPEGWFTRLVPRKDGEREDMYWYSPELNFRLRSKREAYGFLEALISTKGDEALAMEYFKTNKSSVKSKSPNGANVKKGSKEGDSNADGDSKSADGKGRKKKKANPTKTPLGELAAENEQNFQNKEDAAKENGDDVGTNNIKSSPKPKNCEVKSDGEPTGEKDREKETRNEDISVRTSKKKKDNKVDTDKQKKDVPGTKTTKKRSKRKASDADKDRREQSVNA